MRATSGQALALAMLKAFEQPLSAMQMAQWANWLCSLPVKELEVALLILRGAECSEAVHMRIGLLGCVVDCDPRYRVLAHEMATRQALIA